MKDPNNLPHPFEPTADELPPRPGFQFALDRRKFLQLTGGGLIVAIALRDIFSSDDKAMSAETSDVPANEVAAWIHIAKMVK